MTTKRLAKLLPLVTLVIAFGAGQTFATDNASLGKVIHESNISDHKLVYRLIDVKEKMKNIKGTHSSHTMDSAQLKSHHLMVFVTTPDGKEVSEAKAGYLVVGPDGTQQKAMAMFMTGGFGADVDLQAKGDYQVKTKLIIGQATIMDGFKLKID